MTVYDLKELIHVIIRSYSFNAGVNIRVYVETTIKPYTKTFFLIKDTESVNVLTCQFMEPYGMSPAESEIGFYQEVLRILCTDGINGHFKQASK